VSQEPRQGNDATAAAWHPDPSGRHDFRWFNGREWTADVADDGRRGFDPDVSPDPAPTTAHGRAAALTSITLAVIALAISWMPFVVVLGVAAAFSAIVLGVIGMARLRPGAGSGRSLAIAGIACGVAGFWIWPSTVRPCKAASARMKMKGVHCQTSAMITESSAMSGEESQGTPGRPSALRAWLSGPNCSL
jgi:hypothetical protein